MNSKTFYILVLSFFMGYSVCAEDLKIDNNNTEINFKNRSRVMDICRDWYELNKSKAQLPL